MLAWTACWFGSTENLADNNRSPHDKYNRLSRSFNAGFNTQAPELALIPSLWSVLATRLSAAPLLLFSGELNYPEATCSAEAYVILVKAVYLEVLGVFLNKTNCLEKTMDFFFKGLNEEASDCSFNEQDIKKCPFLRNINKPTDFSFSSVNFSLPVRGGKGPIFEDGPNFDIAFKLFHGKDGVVPLSGRSHFHDNNPEPEPAPLFNPLAAKAATISFSAFGSGGPFSFHSFSEKWKMQKKKESSSQGDSSKHEALGNEWLETGNCPIAKSYRAVSHVLPLMATALQPPAGMKFRCPPAVVAARAALARTAFVKTLRPQSLPAKMLAIGVLGMAANVPLGIWREHTRKFSISWFAAVHAAVPFIAMLRKSS
ncbi:unnamed protein product [Ilex paraguariensis]|uniref:Uncharacterized protein n=1 Tax=Ilex paraguariensis TaxID=185542 RepID=A0ABC8UFH0_9AQUA